MKITNIILLLLALVFTDPTSLFAQEDEKPNKKKIIIIKKSIDEDGTEVIEKIIKEGKAAEDFEWENEDGKTFYFKSDGFDGEDIEWLDDDINIIIDDQFKEGDFFNFHFDEHFKDLDKLKDLKIDLYDDDRRFDIRLDDDGEIFEWEGEGEIPENIKEKLKEKNIHLFDHFDRGFFDVEDMNIGIFDKGRAFLGVNLGKHLKHFNEDGTEAEVIDQTVKGAMITKVLSESAAEEAGLQKGDVITKIDETLIESQQDLIKAIRNYDVGDKVSISYTRDGRNSQTEATLKKNSFSPKFHFNKWNSLDENNDINHQIIIKDKSAKVIVIRTKSDKEEGEGQDEMSPVEKPELENVPSNILEVKAFEAFPNPTSGQFRVKFELAPQPITITINDVSGKEVYRETINNFKGYYDQQIDLRNTPKGPLLLQIQQGKKVFSDKIILQ